MSNLLKNYSMNIESDEKRVLDMNTLVERRISALSAKMDRPENAGFVPGLVTDEIEVEHLLGEDAEGGAETGNVIKATPASAESAEKLPAQVQEEAEAILAQAREEADAILAGAREEAEGIKKAARDEGYQAGHAEGEKKAQAEAAGEREKLAEERARLEEELQEKYDEIEPRMVDTLTDIYEHIFRVDLKAYRDVTVHLLATTIQKIEGARSFLVHVGKENYDYVISRKSVLEEAAALPDSVVEIVEDITLSGSDCMIETDGGIFDCGLGTELSELTQKLKLLSYAKE